MTVIEEMHLRAIALISVENLVLVAVAWILGFVITRLYFHPLSKFPGPRIAAVTRWYEFYHDVVRDGTYVKYYPELHKKLGPIVRIAPNHLHVDDPDFYKEVFRNQTPYLKASEFYKSLGITDALVATLDPHKHKIHRTILNPLFSMQALEKLEPVIARIIEQAADNMRQRHKKGKHVDIQKLYRCITVDVISMSLFGYTQELTAKDENDTYPEILASVDMFTKHVWLMKHFSILAKIALKLPPSLAEKILPGHANFRSQCAEWIDKVKARREKGITQTEDGRDTVFDLLLEPKLDKGYEVPAIEQLVDEAFSLLVAGSDTTAYALACTTFYLLNQKNALTKLRQELRHLPRTLDGRLNLANVMGLPYLGAVVREGLRLSSGVPGILPRVVPPAGAVVKNEFIPGGTIVSISARIIHDNADLFPEPGSFKPERWLGEKGKELDRWNVSFSKGPRQCIGINLAYMELHMNLAVFFAEFDMELFETDEKSMEWLDHGVASNASNVKVLAKPIAV